MYCSNCGKQLNDSVSFCPNCGHKILVPDTNENATGPSSNIVEPKKLDNAKIVLPKGFGPHFRFMYGKISSKSQFLYVARCLKGFLLFATLLGIIFEPIGIFKTFSGNIFGFIFLSLLSILLFTPAIPFLLLHKAIKKNSGYKAALIFVLVSAAINFIGSITTIGTKVGFIAILSFYWSMRLLGALNRGAITGGGSSPLLSDNQPIPSRVDEDDMAEGLSTIPPQDSIAPKKPNSFISRIILYSFIVFIILGAIAISVYINKMTEITTAPTPFPGLPPSLRQTVTPTPIKFDDNHCKNVMGPYAYWNAKTEQCLCHSGYMEVPPTYECIKR